MQKWIEKVMTARLEGLDSILDEAAFDDGITNEEYGKIYEAAINRVKSENECVSDLLSI